MIQVTMKQSIERCYFQ